MVDNRVRRPDSAVAAAQGLVGSLDLTATAGLLWLRALPDGPSKAWDQAARVFDGLPSRSGRSRATDGQPPTAQPRQRSLDAVAAWAKRIIPVKSTLTADHAREVEAALEAKLGQIGDTFGEPLLTSGQSINDGHAQQSDDATTLATTDRSTLTIGHTPRRRNKAHLKFVAAQPCLLCGRQPSDPHHLKFAQVQALGRKVSDEFTVPLCRMHHREVHRTVKEQQWWAQFGIEPLAVASELWAKNHALSMPSADSGATVCRVQPAQFSGRPAGARRDRWAQTHGDAQMVAARHPPRAVGDVNCGLKR